MNINELSITIIKYLFLASLLNRHFLIFLDEVTIVMRDRCRYDAAIEGQGVPNPRRVVCPHSKEKEAAGHESLHLYSLRAYNQ